MTVHAGYPKNPLYKKLGLKDGFTIKLVNAPKYYWKLFDLLPKDLNKNDDPNSLKDFIHIFCADEERLIKELRALRKEIKQNGMIWVSWPKKTAQIPTTVNGDVIRKYAFSNILVDVKVCAIDETWSGLKLMIPVKDRTK